MAMSLSPISGRRDRPENHSRPTGKRKEIGLRLPQLTKVQPFSFVLLTFAGTCKAGVARLLFPTDRPGVKDHLPEEVLLPRADLGLGLGFPTCRGLFVLEVEPWIWRNRPDGISYHLLGKR